MKPLFSQKFAILTAENPRYGSAEGGNAALEQEMKAKNLKFTPMKGKYGTPENSYLVENPDHQDILSWGKKYGQDSVIVSDGGHHKMVYTNGPHEGLWHEGHSVSIHNQEPEDFYSTINLNNRPTHFTIDFDMDKKHGNPMKKTLNKMLKSLFPQKLPLYSEYIEPLQKGEKFPHFLKFMGNHPKAPETAQWADENIKHRNLAELAMRHAKTKPEGLNDEEKTHVKHFNDSLHMPEVQKAAGLITSQHDFASGIRLLKEAESAYQKRHVKEAPTLVPMEGEKLLDFGDGVGVYNLGKSKNANEAKAMGHCATPHKGGELWSIRRDHGNGMVEPLVTISHEGGYLGEMKGKHNWKPSTKYHGHIAKLLASDKIKGFVGGGYAPESNFEISDLSEGLRNKLLEYKPSLIQKVYKENLPKGFQGGYSHTLEIKSIFNTNDLATQQKYLAKFSKNTSSHIDVREKVAQNPNTHPDILHKLAEDSDYGVRRGVALNPNIHPDLLHKLAEDSDVYVRRDVAQNPNTHPDLLHKLAEDSDVYVRRGVALNPNIHPDLLHKLAEDSDASVRRNVVRNPQFKNLPLEIQQKVRLLERPLVNTPIQKILAMINDGENNPDPARQATEELKLRRKEKYDKILSPEGNLSDVQHLSESHDNDIAKRARDELKRRGLQKSLKKSDSPKHLIHFSTTPNLTTLDPEFQGTAGRHSPETKHGKPTHPRVYFYEEGTPTESVVTGGAKSKYIIKHPGDDKIIDIAKDTEGLQQQAKEQWLQKPIGSMQDAYFKLLKDKGYLGFKNSASGLPNVVAMFHATPVHAEVPMPKDMSANPDWTKAEVPMSLKKSDVKEAVEKIKGPAKVNEVLDAAQPDMRSKILAALRKEKLAKMNGTGIPGTGGATPPAMRPPVPAAPASMAMSKADESESHMAKKDLKDIMEYAQALDKMVVESEDLEDWVDSKITVARQYLSDIAHYLSYEHGQPTEELDKGDVVSMKDKKVISTDTKPAPKTMVAKQPTAAVYKRGTELAIDSGWKGDAGKTGGKPDLSLVKSDSKKAKFERCVLAVKQKSKDKVNPWAVCHASVGDAKKSEDLEKADMKVKEQEKPTKGMPQAKQLKADADLEKIKEGAENVAKAADKKKSELNKSGYFKEDKKTQLPKWHDPLKEQRESAAQEESELRPESKMHIWAELERHKQMSEKPKTQKPKEELEKGKNVRKQREAVFGGWKTSAGSPRREKQISALADMIKRRFGLEAKRAPGKVAASGKVIDKPSFHDNVVEHIGNPDSLVHEVGHLYQYGKDMESIDPRKEFKAKEQSLGDWQKDMDAHWGDLNVKHGYKKQMQTAEEYEPIALENYYRRRAGLPTHQKTAATEEKNRAESEKRGKKYNQPKVPRTHAVDDPSKEIVQRVKVKGKDGKEKEVWLTGSMKNLTDKTRELVDQIDRGELKLDPTRGYVEGTSVDAKINRRARAASKDKTRKDADTLMRSEDEPKKKLTLIQGEGKPSKATKKATPEEHKAMIDKLSAALDTVKVDTSPEAVKERKMLLEHVKHKLKGQK